MAYRSFPEGYRAVCETVEEDGKKCQWLGPLRPASSQSAVSLALGDGLEHTEETEHESSESAATRISHYTGIYPVLPADYN